MASASRPYASAHPGAMLLGKGRGQPPCHCSIISETMMDRLLHLQLGNSPGSMNLPTSGSYHPFSMSNTILSLLAFTCEARWVLPPLNEPIALELFQQTIALIYSNMQLLYCSDLSQ